MIEKLKTDNEELKDELQLEKRHAKVYDSVSAQAQIAKLQSGAGQANTQIMENEMVLKELDLLEEDAQVFKLIGPVLVKQELVEVKTNVSKRIEFIKNDIGRLESSVKAKEKEQEEVRSQIAKLQKQQAEATGGQ